MVLDEADTNFHRNACSFNFVILGLGANNIAFNLKLEQQAAVGQYPLSSVAVAAAAAAAANLAHSQASLLCYKIMKYKSKTDFYGFVLHI